MNIPCLLKVRKTLTNNAEVALCGGFFLIYFIDEVVHFLFGEAIQNNQIIDEAGNHETNGYGSTNSSENTSLLR